MKEYIAKRFNGMPDWDLIPCAYIDFPLLEADANIKAYAQLTYDDTSFYVRLVAHEEHIRAELNGKLDDVCEDRCLEFFFCPIAGNQRYINVECNPNGCLYLGFGSNVNNLIRLLPENPPINPLISRFPGGWELSYAIPYAFVRNFFPDFAPASGQSIRANFYKCGDKTVIPHYLCWNPVPAEPLTFHNPDAFGIVRFE